MRLGANLAPVVLDQRRESLDPEQTLAEALTGGSGDTVTVGGQSRHVVGYMKDFLFRPEQARTPVGVLSGGERARLILARAFARPSNLLVLDEPTNDLDLETLDLLQERLAEYPGTVLLVSHDRDFLDRVVTSVIASEGDGRWIEYAGGYSDMLAQRGAAPAAVGGRAVARPARPARARGKAQAARPRRMSYNDRRALELLPERIAALQARIETLNAALGRPRSLRARPGAVHRHDRGARRGARRTERRRGAVADPGNAARGDRGRLRRAGTHSEARPLPRQAEAQGDFHQARRAPMLSRYCSRAIPSASPKRLAQSSGLPYLRCVAV